MTEATGIRKQQQQLQETGLQILTRWIHYPQKVLNFMMLMMH